MTIASLVVDIAANQASLVRAVDQANAKLDSITGIAAKVGTALAGAFAVTKIIGMGEQVIDFAGKLTDLSAKTGISTTGLQKLGAAVEQSGVSLDAVSGATTKLARNLIEGDKSAVGALGQLGLSVAELKAMAPEQQFLKVADAIGGIQNPTEKAWAAMQVFGKGGAELLSALDGNMEAAATQAEKLGLIIDEKTVAAADNFGDQLGLLGKQLMGIVATVVGPLLPALSALGNVLAWVGRDILQPVLGASIKVVMTLLAGFWEQLTGVLGGLADLGAKIPGVGGKFAEMSTWLKNSSKASGDYLAQLWDNTDKVEQSAVKAAPALRGLGQASDSANKDAKKLTDELARLEEKINAINASAATGLYNRGSAGDFGAGAVEAEIKRVQALIDAQDKARAIELGTAGGVVAVGVQLDIESAKSALDTLNEMARTSFGGILNSVVGRLPQTLQSAFTGGGGFAGAGKAIASQIGGSLGGKLFEAGGMLNGLGNKLAGTFGSALGIALPGIGTAIGALAGPLLGKLTGKIAGIFKNTEKEVNPIRQAFIDAGGGLAVMNQKAAEAGVTMRAVLDARTPEAYKKAIDDLNAAFEFQDNAMKTLDETVKRYGFTIDELGPAMQRQALDKQAQQLYQDFQVLTAAGLNVDTVLGKMGGSIQDFVTQSLRTGTEIPIAMQPMLQKMVELGQLTDANGNIITNLEDSGVSFAMTMSQGFQELMKSVDKLTQAIARGLGVALDNLPTETDLNVNINYNENGRPSGLADPLRDVDVTPMADGGMGRVTRPTLFLAGEAGAEDFAFSGGGRSFRSGGGSASIDTSGLSAKLDQVNEQQTRLNDYMTGMFARDLARATRDEVQKVAWRKRY